MTILLVAHGTRNPAGGRLIRALADLTARALDEQVRVAFVDVHGPTPDHVLAELRDEPVVLVPAFLSSGQHVRRDIPRYTAMSRHPSVVITRAMGPSSELTWALRDRLHEAGWRPGDAVILAAAGSSDPHAHCDVEIAAMMLSVVVGEQVTIAFCSPSRDGSGYPSVSDAVAAAREHGGGRVAVASYLLAEGLFQARLRDSGADVVAEPLGLHSEVVSLVCARRRQAEAPSRRASTRRRAVRALV